MTAVASSFGLSRIAQIGVVVHDVPRAVAFYRDTLGVRLLFEAPPSMAFFDCGGIRLMLSLPSAPEFDQRALLYYAVDDIEEAEATLTSRGVVFAEKAHIVARLPHADVWLAGFRDPDGNVLHVMSEVKK